MISRCAQLATSASWVTTIIVVPCSCSLRNRSSTIFSFFSSRLPVGSSARISFGSLISARADAHALLLAAGQLAGQVVGAVLQADSFQRLHGLLLIDHRNGSIGPPSRSPPPSGAARGKTSGTRVLSCSYAHRQAGVAFRSSNRRPSKHDGALRGRIHAADHVHQRGFAGTGRADNRQPLPLRNGQTQVVDGVQIAVNLEMWSSSSSICSLSMIIPPSKRWRGRYGWRGGPAEWRR